MERDKKIDLEIVALKATQGKMWVHLNVVLVHLNKKAKRISATWQEVSLECCVPVLQ